MENSHCTLYSRIHKNIFIFLFVAITTISVQGLYAANITLSPTFGTYEVGKTFSVSILLSNNQGAINGISSAIIYSNDTLELTSISKAGSILSIWAEEPTFSNATGRASFEGVVLNPGFSGAQGKILTLNFKTKKIGDGSVTLTSGSVLANDGNATNVLGTLGSASFTVEGNAVESESQNTSTENTSNDQPVVNTSTNTSATTPTITSPTHPDSNTWYSSREVTFEWNVPRGVSAVRTLYGDIPTATPNRVYDPPINNRSFTTDVEGVLYMHVQFRSSNGWGQVAHYKFQIDTDKPEVLKASLPDGVITTSPTPTILITGEDKTSGIDHITMSVDGSDAVTYPLDASNLYRAPKKSPGKHTVVISAIDKAGNASTVSLDYTIQGITPPTIVEYTKNAEVGGTLRITGKTYPKTTVEVTLTKRESKGLLGSLVVFANAEESKPLIQTTTSDEEGNFSLVWSEKLEAGIYDMKMRAIDPKGAMSDYTEERTIVVENLTLLHIGAFVMNWLSLVLIIILALVAIIGTLWYSLSEFGRFRRKVRRAIIEAEDTLRVNIQALRKDTEEFQGILIKAQAKRKLTKEENTMLKKFKKRIQTVEKEIEGKLEQVG
jgi:hypothetical protein